MRRLLQFILLKPILWASGKFASKPRRDKIFAALTNLRQHIIENPGKKGLVIELKPGDKFIVFSDQHRGAKNGADDFWNAEPNYLAALDYYYKNDFQFISLGDCEELWENSLTKVKKYNVVTFEAEKLFIQQNRFYKVFGNHDLLWVNDPLGWWYLKRIYGQEVKVYEGMILQLTIDSKQLTIFLTHGHQGDASSDGNWFSKFFVARIWAPLQAFLRINPNTPAYDRELKTEHNRIMYEWSLQQRNCLLITGHTHQPVFESRTHLEELYKKLLVAKQHNNEEEIKETESEIYKREKDYKSISVDYLQMRPSYFNSGCCCFSDGDITGIEITAEDISLIKWNKGKGKEVLGRALLSELIEQLK
ncbi:MAG: metallophosphoesterase [Chitinophagaceae bacterium]|nr:MAG: metallophosphoesterase [Chitinophagaceae bacterium]